jgi:hypothetical protein
MIDYDVKYVCKGGDTHEFVVTSTDVRTAINNAFELRPEIKRILRCTPAPMFTDEPS